MNSSARPSSSLINSRSTAAIAWAARWGLAAPEITAHDWAIELIRHSSFAAEPITAPSSNHAATIPVAVPCLLLERVLQRSRVLPPDGRARRVLPGVRQRREPVRVEVQHPGQPDALALTAFTHAVHPVVPIAAAHQRKPVPPDSEARVERQGAVLVEAGGLGPRSAGVEKLSCWSAARRGASRNGIASSRIATSPDTST